MLDSYHICAAIYLLLAIEILFKSLEKEYDDNKKRY